MTSLGTQIASRKNNNLNVIRLMLALGVILSHSFSVTLGQGGEARGEPVTTWTCHQDSSGEVAVNLFFLISGFLITASWLRSKSMQNYFMKRVLRIYPGFIAAMIFSAGLIWTFCPEFRANVAHPAGWLWLLLKNLIVLTNSSICQPGIFAGNPLPGMANASLWTIPVEFFCYLMVIVVGLIGLFRWRLLFFLAAMLGYEAYVLGLSHGHDQYECYLICFLTGAAIWLWQDKIPFSKHIAAGCLVVLLVTSRFSPWFLITFPILGGYFVFWLAYGPRLPFSDWAEKTDLSYGTYLYAFPVQQMLAMNSVLRHPWVMFLLATPVSLCFAWLSWHLIEKRFLALKSSARK